MINIKQLAVAALCLPLLLSGCATNDPFNYEITVAEVCVTKGTRFNSEYPSPHSYHWANDENGAPLQFPAFALFKPARSGSLMDVYVADIGPKSQISNFSLNLQYHFNYAKHLPSTPGAWTNWMSPESQVAAPMPTPRARFTIMQFAQFIGKGSERFATGGDCLDAR